MTTIIPEKMVREVPFWEPDLPAEEVERRFRKILGEFEVPSVPLNLRVTEEVELDGGVVRQRVEYDVDENETVPAYHLFKKNLPNDAPGLLSIHGHGAESIFPVGKAYHCHPSPSDPVQYSYIAALNGFTRITSNPRGTEKGTRDNHLDAGKRARVFENKM